MSGIDEILEPMIQEAVDSKVDELLMNRFYLYDYIDEGTIEDRVADRLDYIIRKRVEILLEKAIGEIE